jgi:hypothetical protein
LAKPTHFRNLRDVCAPICGSQADKDARFWPKTLKTGGTAMIADADVRTGKVELEDGRSISLVAAKFRFSGFEDSPFTESDLRSDEYEEQLGATFPDGRLLVFAKHWDLPKGRLSDTGNR